MFRSVGVNEGRLNVGDIVFCQEKQDKKKPDNLFLVEGEIIEVITPSTDAIEKLREKPINKIFPKEELIVCRTKYEVLIRRIICSHVRNGLLRSNSLPVKPGEIYTIPSWHLSVFNGRKIDLVSLRFASILQVTQDVFWKTEATYQDIGFNRRFVSIEKYEPNYELRKLTGGFEEEKGALKSWLSFRGLGPSTSICLKFPVKFVKAIFTDSHHVVWLNPVYYDVPSDDKARPTPQKKSTWFYGDMSDDRIFRNLKKE